MVKKEGHRISCRFTRATTRTVLFVRQGKGEKNSQRRRSVPLCQPRCRVGRCERCEVECESGGAESRETKAKIGSRVLKLRPLCRVGERRRIHGCFPAARWKRKGREEEERWTDRCLEAILVSSSVPCAFRMSASKVERVCCVARTREESGVFSASYKIHEP